MIFFSSFSGFFFASLLFVFFMRVITNAVPLLENCFALTLFHILDASQCVIVVRGFGALFCTRFCQIRSLRGGSGLLLIPCKSIDITEKECDCERKCNSAL